MCRGILLVGFHLVEQARERDAAVVAFKNGDWSTAAALLTALADRDDRNSQYLLGLLYAYGLGVPRDRDRARSFIVAARQGEPNERRAILVPQRRP
jgi:TPR repeat protein